MAKSGRKPQPTALKIARGVRKDRIPVSEPPLLEGEIEMPSYLDERAREEWGRMARLMGRMGILSASHGPALGLYCMSYSRLVNAEEQLRKEGSTVPTKLGGHQSNPYVRIAREASRQMQSLLVEFGMTPSSSTRVAMRPMEIPVDELEEFLKRG